MISAWETISALLTALSALSVWTLPHQILRLCNWSATQFAVSDLYVDD